MQIAKDSGNKAFEEVSEEKQNKNEQTKVWEYSLGCLKHLENKGWCCLHEPSH